MTSCVNISSLGFSSSLSVTTEVIVRIDDSLGGVLMLRAVGVADEIETVDGELGSGTPRGVACKKNMVR